MQQLLQSAGWASNRTETIINAKFKNIHQFDGSLVASMASK